MGSAVTGSDRMDILHFFLPKGADMALMEEPWPVKAASPLGLSFPLLGEAFKPCVFIASGVVLVPCPASSPPLLRPREDSLWED